jgi:hypothetical protein
LKNKDQIKPTIIIDGFQIKSLGKARKLSKALEIIEEECGIKVCKITFKNMFICPWIDFKKLNKTDMEKLVRRLCLKLK